MLCVPDLLACLVQDMLACLVQDTHLLLHDTRVKCEAVVQ